MTEKSELFLHPDNPVPEGSRVGVAQTPDGAKLRHAHWLPPKHSGKGTIIIASGRNEYIEKYFETINDLLNLGFAVVAFDWRGQGGSSRLIKDGRRGFIRHFDQYIADLNTIIEDVALPDCPGPFYILGHSTGSLVALLAAPSNVNRIRRMVLAAPMLELYDIPVRQSLLGKFAAVGHYLGFGKVYVSKMRGSDDAPEFEGNTLTSSPERFARNTKLAIAAPNLTLGPPTVSWLHAAIKAMERVWDPEFVANIAIPTLLLPAGNDKVVSTPRAEEFGTKMRSGSHLTMIGARHEIMQERDEIREQFLAALSTYIPGTIDA